MDEKTIAKIAYAISEAAFLTLMSMQSLEDAWFELPFTTHADITTEMNRVAAERLKKSLADQGLRIVELGASET